MPQQDAADLKGRTGFTRLFNAFHYSCDGFRAIWATEQAFRQEAILAVILIPVAILLPVSWTQSALLVLSVFLLLIVETLNSAVEAAIDRIGPEALPCCSPFLPMPVSGSAYCLTTFYPRRETPQNNPAGNNHCFLQQ